MLVSRSCACRPAHEHAARRAARCPSRALRRAEHRPHGILRHQHGRAQLAQQRRFLVVHRRLQRHERHEAARLRVVERGEAVLIHGVHVDAEGREQLDDLFVALADGVVQRRAAANSPRVVDQRDDVDVGAGFVQGLDQLQRLRFRRAAREHRMDRRLPVRHVEGGVGAVLEQQLDDLEIAVGGRADQRRGAARERRAPPRTFAGLKNSCMFGFGAALEQQTDDREALRLVRRIDRRASAVDLAAQADRA